MIPPERDPCDLVLAVNAAVKGRVTWELRNADGSLAQSGEQDNLILDRGLDQLMLNVQHGTSSSGAGLPYYGYWRRYLCLGTGSSAPAVTQTALVAEVVRTGAEGGFGNAETVNAVNVSGGLVTGTFTGVKVFDFTSSYNLTEFGYSENATANTPICIRELFRDGNGNPITLSVQAGQQLKMLHTLTFSVPFAATPYNVTIANLGTFQGNGTFFASSSANYMNILVASWNPANITQMHFVTVASSPDPTANLGGVTGGTNTVVGAYTTGSFARTNTVQFATSAGNGTVYGFQLNNNASAVFGYKYIFSSPASFVKASTHKLSMAITFTVARAS